MIVTTTHLEMPGPSALVPARPPREAAAVVRVDEPSPEFSRFLYTAVGGDWHWTDRLPWSYERWIEWLARPGSETWVCWVHGTPAGYVELAAELGASTDVEIAYFGLLPRFTGRGLGGHLLTEGARRAWTLAERHPDLPPVGRVHVHTCTLDGPYALANYVARGFRVHLTIDAEESVAAAPPGPWPGARGA